MRRCRELVLLAASQVLEAELARLLRASELDERLELPAGCIAPLHVAAERSQRDRLRVELKRLSEATSHALQRPARDQQYGPPAGVDSGHALDRG
jgi:hypothetical protein